MSLHIVSLLLEIVCSALLGSDVKILLACSCHRLGKLLNLSKHSGKLINNELLILKNLLLKCCNLFCATCLRNDNCFGSLLNDGLNNSLYNGCRSSCRSRSGLVYDNGCNNNRIGKNDGSNVLFDLLLKNCCELLHCICNCLVNDVRYVDSNGCNLRLGCFRSRRRCGCRSRCRLIVRRNGEGIRNVCGRRGLLILRILWGIHRRIEVIDRGLVLLLRCCSRSGRRCGLFIVLFLFFGLFLNYGFNHRLGLNDRSELNYRLLNYGCGLFNHGSRYFIGRKLYSAKELSNLVEVRVDLVNTALCLFLKLIALTISLGKLLIIASSESALDLVVLGVDIGNIAIKLLTVFLVVLCYCHKLCVCNVHVVFNFVTNEGQMSKSVIILGHLLMLSVSLLNILCLVLTS